MESPVAGDPIPSLCTVVIRGGRKPDVVLDISNFAEASGTNVPIPDKSPNTTRDRDTDHQPLVEKYSYASGQFQWKDQRSRCLR